MKVKIFFNIKLDNFEKLEETQTINYEDLIGNLTSNLNESINFFLDNSMLSGIITKRSKEESLINAISNNEKNQLMSSNKKLNNKDRIENSKNHLFDNFGINKTYIQNIEKNLNKIKSNYKINYDNKNIKNENNNEKQNMLFNSLADLYSRNKKPNNILNNRNTDLNFKDNRLNIYAPKNHPLYEKFKTQNPDFQGFLNNENDFNNKILNKNQLNCNLDSENFKGIKTNSLQNLNFNAHSTKNSKNVILKNNYEIENFKINKNTKNKELIAENNNIYKNLSRNNKNNQNQSLKNANIKMKTISNKNNSKTKNIINDYIESLKNTNKHSNINAVKNPKFYHQSLIYENINKNKEKVMCTKKQADKKLTSQLQETYNDHVFNLKNKSKNKSQLDLNSISEETIESKIVNENLNISDYICFKTDSNINNNDFIKSQDLVCVNNIQDKIILENNNIRENFGSIRDLNINKRNTKENDVQNSTERFKFSYKNSKENLNFIKDHLMESKDKQNRNDLNNKNDEKKNNIINNFNLNLELNEKKTRNKNIENDFVNSNFNNNIYSNSTKSLIKPINSLTYNNDTPLKFFQNLYYKTQGESSKNSKSNKRKNEISPQIVSKENFSHENNILKSKKSLVNINIKKQSNFNQKISHSGKKLNIKEENKHKNKNQHLVNPDLIYNIKAKNYKIKNSFSSNSNNNLITKEHLNNNIGKEKSKMNSASNHKNNLNNVLDIIKNQENNDLRKNKSFNNFQLNQFKNSKDTNSNIKNEKKEYYIQNVFNKQNLFLGKNSLSYNFINPKFHMKSESNSDHSNSQISKNFNKNQNNSIENNQKNSKANSKIINLNFNLNFNNLNFNLNNKSSEKEEENKIIKSKKKSIFSQEKTKNQEYIIHNTSTNTNSVLKDNCNNKNIENIKDLGNIDILSDLLKISIPDKHSRNKKVTPKIITSSLSKLTNNNLFNTQYKDRENLTNKCVNDLNYNLTNKTNTKSNLNLNSNQAPFNNNISNTINHKIKANSKKFNLNSIKSNPVIVSLKKNNMKEFNEGKIEYFADNKNRELFSFKKIEFECPIDDYNIKDQDNNKKDINNYKSKINELGKFDENSITDLTCSKEISYSELNNSFKKLNLYEKSNSSISYNNYTNCHSNYHDFHNNKNKEFISLSKKVNSQNLINELSSSVVEEIDNNSDSNFENNLKNNNFGDSKQNEKKVLTNIKETIKYQTDLKPKSKPIFNKNKSHSKELLNLNSKKNSILHLSNKDLFFSDDHKINIRNSIKNLSPNDILSRNKEFTSSNNYNKNSEKQKRKINSVYSKSINDLGLLNFLMNNPLIQKGKIEKNHKTENLNSKNFEEIKKKTTSKEKKSTISQEILYNSQKEVSINNKKNFKNENQDIISFKTQLNIKNPISRNKIVNIQGWNNSKKTYDQDYDILNNNGLTTNNKNKLINSITNFKKSYNNEYKYNKNINLFSTEEKNIFSSHGYLSTKCNI